MGHRGDYDMSIPKRAWVLFVLVVCGAFWCAEQLLHFLVHHVRIGWV